LDAGFQKKKEGRRNSYLISPIKQSSSLFLPEDGDRASLQNDEDLANVPTTKIT
jgi:hypothetical protein